MRRSLQIGLVAVIAVVGLLAAAKPVVADPSYGSDAAFPVLGAAPNTVLGPIPGAPVFGPAPAPPVAVLPSLLAPPNPPGFGEVDDISYGDENPTYFPMSVEFSTGPGVAAAPTLGNLAGPVPPPPLFNLRAEAGLIGLPPFGDGAVYSDVYALFPGPMPFLPPCIVYGNVQILDGDGAPGAPFGPPRLALNMPEPGSNIDAYERTGVGAVTAIPGAPLIDAPVFFTIDAATAGAWGAPIPAPTAGPPVFAMPAPGDILAWNPAVGGPVIWATAASLGLPPGSDIDALAVTYTSGFPLPSFLPGPSGRDFGPPGDYVVFSLAPGSPPLSPTSGGAGLFGSVCFGAGTATAGDLFINPAPFGVVLPWLDAEQMGLGAIRSGNAVDDNVDAIDICNTTPPPFSDIDGDTIVDDCDFDNDGDGIGDAIDPDDDGDGFGDAQQPMHLGPANTAAGFDNCPTIANPTQINTDGNFLDNSPPYAMAVDDRTMAMSDAAGDACDADDDNDGITDLDEVSGAACSGFVTSALRRDTDSDRFLDGAECTLGTDPTLFASKPLVTACGPAGDADGDKLSDRIEFCYYGTSSASTDSDVDAALDGAIDGCEAVSLNGDRIANVADMGMLATAISMVPFRIVNVDINKDGAWNPADQGILATFISPSGQCPS